VDMKSCKPTLMNEVRCDKGSRRIASLCSSTILARIKRAGCRASTCANCQRGNTKKHVRSVWSVVEGRRKRSNSNGSSAELRKISVVFIGPFTPQNPAFASFGVSVSSCSTPYGVKPSPNLSSLFLDQVPLFRGLLDRDAHHLITPRCPVYHMSRFLRLHAGEEKAGTGIADSSNLQEDGMYSTDGLLQEARPQQSRCFRPVTSAGILERPIAFLNIAGTSQDVPGRAHRRPMTLLSRFSFVNLLGSDRALESLNMLVGWSRLPTYHPMDATSHIP